MQANQQNNRGSNTLLAILVVIAVGATLRLGSHIFLPFIIATLLLLGFSPLINFLSRHRVPHTIIIVMVLLIMLAGGTLFGLIMFSGIRSLLQIIPRYQARLLDLLADLQQRFSISNNMLNELTSGDNLRNLLFTISNNFFSFLIGLMLVLIIMMFFLIEHRFTLRKLLRVLSPHIARRLQINIEHINRQVGRYLGVKILISLATGIIVFGIFSLIGVELAFVWGMLAFLFNFIPSIGSIAISIICSLFSILQFYPQWNMIILTSLSISTIEMLLGNVIEPQLMGERLNISPVIIILALLINGWLLGIVGMFLAVPMVAALKIVMESIPATRHIGILMGGANLAERSDLGVKKKFHETK